MRHWLFVAILCVSFTATSQFSTEVWHDGFIVTSNKDTLRGQVKYNMEANSVQFYNREVVRTYSSYQVFYLNIYDEVLENYREFYTIPYKLKTDYETPVIFELLYEGELSLLSREALVQETVPTGAGFYSGSLVRDRLRQYFYFVDKKGKMYTFSGKKGDLFTIMAKKQRKVKEFVKQNRLKTDSSRDLVRITAFYNSI